MMKTRKVMISLECDTDIPMRDLKCKWNWEDIPSVFDGYQLTVKQVQANVIRPGESFSRKEVKDALRKVRKGSSGKK